MIDYYEILKVPFQSDNDRIRKAYYKLARIWHPDKNKDSLALIKFQEISLAYKTLSNKHLRMMYDYKLIMDENSDHSIFSFNINSKTNPLNSNQSTENLNSFFDLFLSNSTKSTNKKTNREIGSKRQRE